MTTAFVLAGGASLGAVQVGMLHALADRDITPDLLVGTSAGALNGAYIAGHGAGQEGIEGLTQVWRSLRTWRLFPPEPRRAASALLGHATALFSDRGLRELIQGPDHLLFDNLEDAGIPLILIATDLLTGEEAALTSGPAVEAILASSAIPGLLPPVPWHGRLLADGGLADNAAISQAVRAGADRIYVLPCGYPYSVARPPRTAMAALTQAMALLVHHPLARDVELYADRADLVVIPPPRPVETTPLDFSHAAELIEPAYRVASQFLDIDGGHREVPSAHVLPGVRPSAAG